MIRLVAGKGREEGREGQGRGQGGQRKAAERRADCVTPREGDEH